MTKRSACRNQLLNEAEGAEDAGTSRALAGSAPPTQRCTYQFSVLVVRNRCFPPTIVNNRRRDLVDPGSIAVAIQNIYKLNGPRIAIDVNLSMCWASIC
jgi:hypothetical protein